MSRPRKTKRNVPPYVYFGKGRWFWREYLGAGKFGREVRLASPEASDQQIWDAYLELVGTGDKRGTLDWLGRQYFASVYFSRRKPATQREYRRYFQRISSAKLASGKQFGDIELRRITPGVIRKYMDLRASKAPVMANRELEFLSVIFSFGMERDFLPSNPAAPVKPQPELPRTRYVTDEEYKAVYDRAPPYIQVAMELAYLCRLRRGEIIGPDPRDIDPSKPAGYEGLKRQHILPEGLRVVRAKGSKEQIIGWSDRLLQVVEHAKALAGPASAAFLLHNKQGQQIRKRAFATAWQRVMKKAMTEAGISPFTFHDLKAKGVSDFEGDKAKASGHKSLRMVSVYDRSTEVVDSTR